MSGGRAKAELRDAHGVHDVVPYDLLHDIDPFRDLAEHGVHAVQVARIVLAQDHEELTAAGVLAGVRHRERTDFVLVGVAGSLALDLVAGTARADSWVAGRKILR